MSAAVGAASGAPSAAPALELAGVSSGYDRMVVLREVSLTVPRGEVTALLGPNGAGKTTLLRTVAGFLPTLRGTVRLHGEDVSRLPAHRRFGRGLGLVPEGRGVFRSLTVRENILVQAGLRNVGEALDRATAAFPRLGDRLGQLAGTLSGGEQQMLAVAAAYVRRPELLLIDEASLGLAPVLVDEIYATLADIAAGGASLLVVDQFADRVLALATSACLLRRGEVVYAGPAATLREDEDLFSHYVGAAAEPAGAPGRTDP